VLVVDDTPHNVKLLADLLGVKGYAVATAANGEEALAKVASESPDLILLDVMMPGLSGYDVCVRLRADPATALLPIYANEILHVGPRGYGLLSAALELGSLLMALVLLARGAVVHPGRSLLIAVGVFGVATVVFGFSRWFPLSFAAFVVAGMADQVSVVCRSIIIQLSTPDELRGRVSSVNLMFIGASNQLGAVESGFVAALTSATFAVVSGGVLCLGVLVLLAVKMPELRTYRIGSEPP